MDSHPNQNTNAARGRAQAATRGVGLGRGTLGGNRPSRSRLNAPADILRLAANEVMGTRSQPNLNQRGRAVRGRDGQILLPF